MKHKKRQSFASSEARWAAASTQTSYVIQMSRQAERLVQEGSFPYLSFQLLYFLKWSRHWGDFSRNRYLWTKRKGRFALLPSLPTRHLKYTVSDSVAHWEVVNYNTHEPQGWVRAVTYFRHIPVVLLINVSGIKTTSQRSELVLECLKICVTIISVQRRYLIKGPAWDFISFLWLGQAQMNLTHFIPDNLPCNMENN